MTTDRMLCCVVLALLSTAATAQTSSLIDLGAGTRVYGLNANGDFTGCITASGTTHAFLSSQGVVTDLGTLGGAHSCGYALNASKQVTGYAEIAGGAAHAFLYNTGAMTDIGTVGGFKTSVGLSINATGMVAGYSYNLDAYPAVDLYEKAIPLLRASAFGDPATVSAFSFSQSTLTQLAPGSTGYLNSVMATGVNDAGLFAGMYIASCAFVCPNVTPFDIRNTFVETLQVVPTVYAAVPTAMNATGGAAAYGEDELGWMHGMVLNTAGPTGPTFDFGRGTVAFGINDSGQAVGAGGILRALPKYTGVAGDTSALIFNNGIPTDLNIPGATPTAINNDGWITLNHQSLDHAYILQTSDVSLSPTGLTFGNIPNGTTSNFNNAFCGDCKVTLTNHTAAPISVGTISIAGTGFAQTNNCPTSLAAAASCVVSVTYTPTKADLTYGQLSVAVGAVQYATVLRGGGAPSITMTSTATDVEIGTAFTVSWTGSAASDGYCVQFGAARDVGGGASDVWSDTKALMSGATQLTESVAGTYTFKITCTVQSQSGYGQQVVNVHAKSTDTGGTNGGGSSGGTTGGGGGGALDWAVLAALAGAGLSRRRALAR